MELLCCVSGGNDGGSSGSSSARSGGNRHRCASARTHLAAGLPRELGVVQRADDVVRDAAARHLPASFSYTLLWIGAVLDRHRDLLLFRRSQRVSQAATTNVSYQNEAMRYADCVGSVSWC